MAASRPATARARVETALALAARLPDLLVAARRIAANVHARRARPPPSRARARRSGSSAPTCRASRRGRSTGAARRATTISMCASANGKPRRRCGSGSTFRRPWISARGFRTTTKLDRAVILMLALAEMLGRGGERVGMPGLAEPRIGRDAADRLAEVLAACRAHRGLAAARPRRPLLRCGRPERFPRRRRHRSRERLRALAGRGAGTAPAAGVRPGRGGVPL